MECAISSSEWKLKSRNKRMSEYITCSLEAFAVLMYYNAFPVWNQRWTVDTGVNTASNNDDVSTISGLTPNKGFFFTQDSKGARKYEGWNNDGMAFYNDLLALVKKQREQPGCTFERDLLVVLSKRRSKGRENNAENQPPRVSNQVHELMQIVGV
jgi:hypothetical protein